MKINGYKVVLISCKYSDTCKNYRAYCENCSRNKAAEELDIHDDYYEERVK